MKIKIITTIIITLLSLQMYASDISNLLVISADGSQTAYALASVNRINVVSDATNVSMTIVDNEGNQYSGYIKILFAETTTKLEELDITSVYVYPNPVVNTLSIQGVGKNASLEVYSLTGKSILNATGTELDVTLLMKGTYILRINQQYIKFIKK